MISSQRTIKTIGETSVSHRVYITSLGMKPQKMTESIRVYRSLKTIYVYNWISLLMKMQVEKLGMRHKTFHL